MSLKILVVDIETVPGEAYVWSQKDQFIPLERLKRPGHIISIGWRWLGQGVVQYADAWPYDSRTQRAMMLTRFHAALEQADCIVSYNGKSFDLPRINGEFVLFGLPPLPKRPHIDVYQTVRGLGFWSGKLEYVLKHLDEGSKGKTGGFSLWRDYMEGDEKARKRMRTYNRRDVARTGKLYQRLRPYMQNHPRLHDHPACPYCGSKRTQARGFRKLEFFKVQRHACLNPRCKGWFEGRRSKI